MRVGTLIKITSLLADPSSNLNPQLLDKDLVHLHSSIRFRLCSEILVNHFPTGWTNNQPRRCPKSLEYRSGFLEKSITVFLFRGPGIDRHDRKLKIVPVFFYFYSTRVSSLKPPLYCFALERKFVALSISSRRF
jgi:hypothetical protein